MKDKGNYDYKEINEAAISLPAEVFSKLGDTLRLRLKSNSPRMRAMVPIPRVIPTNG